MPVVHALIPPAELYARTGIQHLPFNTIYQLAAERAGRRLRGRAAMLLIPDLFGFWLAGSAVTEVTNASTTGAPRRPSPDLGRGPDRAARPAARPVHAQLARPGEIRSGRSARVRTETRSGLRSARRPWSARTTPRRRCVGVPADARPASPTSPAGPGGSSASSWTRRSSTEESRAANFTNEGGVDGRIRYLRNVMGLWLLQECLRTWARGQPERLPALLVAAGRAAVRRAGRRPRRPGVPAAGRHAGRIAAACAPASAAGPPATRAGDRPLHPRQPAAPSAPGRPRRGPAVRAGGRRRPPGRRRRPERAALPAHRRRLRAAGARRPGRGDRARQRSRPGARRGGLADRAISSARRRRERSSGPTAGRSGACEPPPRRAARAGPERCASRCSSPATTTRCSPRSARRSCALLRRLGVEVEFPAAQTCCGQMHFNSGYRDACVPLVERFVDAFAGYDAVVTPSASCAAMVRHHHPVVASWRRARRDAGSPSASRRRAARLRADRVPGRRARRDRRRRVLPAHRRVPPDLPLDAAARRR